MLKLFALLLTVFAVGAVGYTKFHQTTVATKKDTPVKLAATHTDTPTASSGTCRCRPATDGGHLGSAALF